MTDTTVELSKKDYFKQLRLFFTNPTTKEFIFDMGHISTDKINTVKNLTNHKMWFQIDNHIIDLPPNEETEINIILTSLAFMLRSIKCKVPLTEIDLFDAYELGFEMFKNEPEKVITGDIAYQFLLENPGICENTPVPVQSNSTSSITIPRSYGNLEIHIPNNSNEHKIGRDFPPQIYAPFGNENNITLHASSGGKTPFSNITKETIECPDKVNGCQILHYRTVETITPEQEMLRNKFNNKKISYYKLLERWHTFYDKTILDAYNKYYDQCICPLSTNGKTISLPKWEKISYSIDQEYFTKEQIQWALNEYKSWRGYKIDNGVIESATKFYTLHSS